MHIKVFLLLITFGFNQLIFGQHSHAIKQSDLTKTYVYNNFQDTIVFYPIGEALQPAVKQFELIDSIQIDGIGRKELIFRLYESHYQNMAAQTFTYLDTTNYEVIEIWNIDTKRKLFTATTHYDTDYVYWEEFRSKQNRTGQFSYNYTFEIGRLGQVLLSNFKPVLSQHNPYSPNQPEIKLENIKPDHPMGRYIYDFNIQQFVSLEDRQPDSLAQNEKYAFLVGQYWNVDSISLDKRITRKLGTPEFTFSEWSKVETSESVRLNNMIFQVTKPLSSLEETVNAADKWKFDSLTDISNSSIGTQNPGTTLTIQKSPEVIIFSGNELIAIFELTLMEEEQTFMSSWNVIQTENSLVFSHPYSYIRDLANYSGLLRYSFTKLP